MINHLKPVRITSISLPWSQGREDQHQRVLEAAHSETPLVNQVRTKALTSSGGAEDRFISANLDSDVGSDGSRDNDNLGNIIHEGSGQCREGRDSDGGSANTSLGSMLQVQLNERLVSKAM